MNHSKVERRGEDAHMCICRTMCDVHLASKYAEAYLKAYKIIAELDNLTYNKIS